MQEVAQQGAKPGPNLRDRPLAAARSTRAQGNRTGNELDQGDARTNLPLMMVIGGNHRVRAMPFGLGGKGEDEHSADEPAERRDQQQKPRNQRMRRHGEPGHRGLAARTRFRAVSGDHAQRVVFRNTGGNVERDGPQPGHDAHQRRQSKKSNLRPKAVLAQLHDFGNKTENPLGGREMRRARSHDIQSFSLRVLDDSDCLLECMQTRQATQCRNHRWNKKNQPPSGL